MDVQTVGTSPVTGVPSTIPARVKGFLPDLSGIGRGALDEIVELLDDRAKMRHGPFWFDGTALRWDGIPTPAELTSAWRYYYGVFQRSRWALADLIGLAVTLGEDYMQILGGPFGVSEATMRNLYTLWLNFPPERRLWRLPPSYYQAVLSLRNDDKAPDTEAQNDLLEAAWSGEWDREQLRDAVKAKRGITDEPTVATSPGGQSLTAPEVAALDQFSPGWSGDMPLNTSGMATEGLPLEAPQEADGPRMAAVSVGGELIVGATVVQECLLKLDMPLGYVPGERVKIKVIV